jgi:5-oxopent-3-ene-1,2,5-tricarboxylate decarboxylase/2-hydroxyhepta-2,4-diene-1,7-dioate isomerase
MDSFDWGQAEDQRLSAIRDNLAQVSTATACQMLISQGWRNGYMLGLLPLRPLGLGVRLVGRARTCRYLSRRGPEGPPNPAARRMSPEIVLIEEIQPGDILCVDALGTMTSGIIGDILSARLKSSGVAAAVIHGVVRDSPYIAELGLPVYSAGIHPSHSGRDLIPVDFDRPIDMAGVHVQAGDIILADDVGVIAMPLDLAEYIATHGPPKEHLEAWIRGKVLAGGSIHEYYPPSAEKIAEYEVEMGHSFAPPRMQGSTGDDA